MSAAEKAPFQQLAKMIERELELAGSGQLDELQGAIEETGAFMATLPSPAPESARPTVERARALHNRLIIEVTRVRDQLQHSRESLRTAKRVTRTYAQAPSGRYSTDA